MGRQENVHVDETSEMNINTEAYRNVLRLGQTKREVALTCHRDISPFSDIPEGLSRTLVLLDWATEHTLVLFEIGFPRTLPLKLVA